MTRALLSVWLTGALMGCGTGPKQPNGWNVLLVSVDTLRADHLASYGATGIRTVASDRLASEGVLFEDVTSVAPTTLPAHASLFTGLTPIVHGVRDNVGFTLRRDVPTLASRLKANDYETAGFVGAFVLDSRFGIARGFDVWDDELGPSADGLEAGIVAQRRGDAVLDSAFRWLDGRPEGTRPFFAFVHFYDPHTPYESPGDNDAARYRGEVAYTDSLVGKLLDGIEQRRLGPRTLVVLTSDHGESLGEHGELTHGLFVYESTLRIPLILRFPGAPTGKRIPGLARIVDVMPTILDLLGLPALEEAGGESLVARIEGQPPRREPAAYAETFVPRLHYGWSELRAVRRGRHKLVLAPRPELFDLEEDPDETRNLVEEEVALAKSLENELRELLDRESVPIEPSPVDTETRRKLEALGYASAAATEGDLADPKDRIDLYLALNDTTLESLEPGDDGFEDALARLEGVLGSEPTVPRAYVLYGDLLLRAGRLHDAERSFEKLTELESEQFDGYYGLGVARARQGKWPEATLAFEQALALEPSSSKALFQMAELESARGNLEAAEQWLRRAIAIASDPFLIDRLASVLQSAGKSAEARALLIERLQAAPEDPAVVYRLGQLLLDGGDVAEAIPLLRRAAALGPDDVDSHLALGNALAAAGSHEEAVGALREAVALSPCLAQAQSNLGASYAALGRISEAIQSFEKSVSCDPTYALGYKNLAAMELERGNVTAAVEAMRQAVRASGDDPELKRMLEELVAYERSRD